MGKGAVLGCGLWLAGISFAATWQIETVDPSGTGKFSSMKADREGNLHVAYIVQDGNEFPLKYAFRDHRLNRWFLMTVDHSAGSCSLALDSQQRPHISYVDFGTAEGSKLHHAYWDAQSGSWRKEAIRLNSEVIAYYTSIVLDAEDHPSISFYEYRGPKDTDLKIRMRVVSWNGTSWMVRTVDPEEGSGKFNSMAIDAQGHLHLAYANVSSGTEGLRYGYWDGKSWTTRVVDDTARNNGDAVGYSVAMALDKDGNPHIAYMDESTPMLKYAVRKQGQWQIQTVARLAGIGYPDRNSIVVDENGRPFISYYDGGRGALNVAYLEGQQWLIDRVEANATGFTSSIQIVNGQLWVSYADEANGALKVAHKDLPAERTKTEIHTGDRISAQAER
jgi:hypothetical protein